MKLLPVCICISFTLTTVPGVVYPPRSERQRNEPALCVPVGTCIERHRGGVDVRVVESGEDGQCPRGQEYCAQHFEATRCGFIDDRNLSTADGPAPYGAHPWLAYLVNQTGYTGSGVLLDRRHVLTAAHKVYRSRNSLNRLYVYMGVHNGEDLSIAYRRTVERMIVHPNFDANTLRNDVAVLRLRSGIPLGYQKNVGTGCLPRRNANFINQRCTVAGWGATNFNVDDSPTSRLKQVKVPIVSYETCRRSMLQLLGSSTDIFLDKDGEICAGGESRKDACTDDGGAPLICNDENGRKVVAGLVIWGKNCGRRNVYGVYVDVPSYVDWIRRAVRELQS